jgi:type I restriction enzyme S subunit
VATLLSYYKEKLNQQASKTAQKNINLEILNNLFVIIPPITLQNKFAKIVQKNEDNIRKQKDSLVKLEELYSTSMQESFSF